MKSAILTGLAVLAVSSLSQAQVLAEDCFDYNGLLTANGWTNHSGTGKFLTADGQKTTLDHSGGSGEDANLFIGVQGATDTIYASFAFSVQPADLSGLDASGLYFAHFKDSGFAFRARTGVVVPSGTGDFGLAVNGDNSNLGAGATWSGDLSFDTWYKVVISWNAATGEGKLWLDPATSASTSIAHTGTNSGDLMEAFALRQSNDYTGFMDVDGVIVGKTFDDVCPPAPVSYCTAGTSASGCTATIGSSGTPSASAGAGFDVTTTGVEGNKDGLFFFGCNGRQANSWGNGTSFQCVVPPVRRAGLLTGSGTTGVCDGSFSQDINTRWATKPASNPGPGALVQIQFWYRDPLNTSNQTTSLSDALECHVRP